MGIGIGLLLIAAGAILAWGITGDISEINEEAVGWILMVIGLLGIVLSGIFWTSWFGPGRRRDNFDYRP